MGVTAWSRNPDENGFSDPSIPASDGAAARDYQRGQRSIMAAIRRHADDLGGGIVSGGIDNAYTLQTYGGPNEYRRGSALSFIADRVNTGAASLAVDGYAPLSLLDRNGQPLLPNALRPGRLARIFYDPTGPSWRLEGLEVIKNDDFDPAPPQTIKGNAGQGLTDLAVDAARTLLQIDHVANKTEAEMVAEGAIAEALATKAAPADIDTALLPIVMEIGTKAAKTDLDPINSSLTNLADDLYDVHEQVDAIVAGQSSGTFIAKSWAALAAITPTANARAEVLDGDAGTHTDPVVGGTVANSGTYVGRATAPIGWERIGQTTAAAAATQVGTGIAPTTLPLAAQYGLVLKNLTTGALASLSNPDSIAWIQEVSVPTVFTKEITDAVVTDTSTIIIAGDEERVGDISIQVPLNFEVGLNFTDNPAVFDQPGTWLQRSGEWVNHPNPGKNAVAAICRRVGGAGDVSCKLNVRITRKVDGLLPGKLADAVFSKWVDPVDPRYKAVIRAEIDFLQGYGIYEKLKGWWMPGGSKNNFRVNLANPATPLLVYTEGEGGITFTPYKSIKGDGIASTIDTKLTPTDLSFDATGHFMAAKATGPGSTSSIMVSSASPALRAGSVSGVYGFISGASPESNTGDPKADLKWYAVCRRDAQNIIAFVDGQEIFNRPRAFTPGTARTMRILSNIGASPSGFSAVPCGGVAAGPPLSAQSIQRFNESCLRIEAVCTQIVGA